MTNQEIIDKLIVEILSINEFSDVERPTYTQMIKCDNGQDAEAIVASQYTTIGDMRRFFASERFGDDDLLHISDYDDDFYIAAEQVIEYDDIAYINYLRNILIMIKPIEKEFWYTSSDGHQIKLTKEDVDRIKKL